MSISPPNNLSSLIPEEDVRRLIGRRRLDKFNEALKLIWLEGYLAAMKEDKEFYGKEVSK